MNALRQFWCGLFGHAVILRIEPKWVGLQCAHCGYQTPGWTLDRRRPRIGGRRVLRFKRRLAA